MKHTINSQNTKQMLADALIALSCKKAFSKITVSKIVNYCNINRKTFYYHFSDIYDLLEWYLNNEVMQAVSTYGHIEDINAIITYTYNYINKHTYLKNFAQDTIARDKMTQILQTITYPKSYEMIVKYEQSQKQSLDSDFKEFLAKTLTRIIIFSIFDTIEHPSEYEIEKMKQYLSTLFYIY